MQLLTLPGSELVPVVLEARAELHGRLDKAELQTRRVSVGEPQAMPLRPEDLADGPAGEFLRQQAAAFWLLNLTISFYPEPKEPVDSAAIGLLLSHDGPAGSATPIAWSIWPTKLGAPASQCSTIAVTAKLGLVEPQLSRSTTRESENPFLLGLGERQCDPEWRFRRISGHDIEGIHRLAAIIRAPREVRVTAGVTVAASICRRVAGLVRYRAAIPTGLASVTLPPHRK